MVEFARDVGLAAADDETIAARARETEAALVTRDLDFADVRRYPPEAYFGLVVLRLPTARRKEFELSGITTENTR